VDTKLMGMPLKEKEAYTKKIILDANIKFNGNLAVIFTGGKDSLIMLHLVKETFGGKVPFPVLTIDTSVRFKEIENFIEKITKEWDLNLSVLRNEEALKEIEIAADKAECCRKLKTEPFISAIRSNGWKAVLTAIRWEEQEVKKDEEYFSEENYPLHIRVNPILHFREFDVWTYIKRHNLPYCELYRKGYRSIDCEPCRRPQKRKGSERDEEIIKRLKDLGYF
jgi:phosphoadenosine phosphosulfate reductase